VKRPSRKPAAKGKVKAFKPIRHARPYALPPLFGRDAAKNTGDLELFCRSAIRAAWMAGEHSRVKAAREDIARWRLTPADIAAVARELADYNTGRAWSGTRETAQKLDWLSVGSGCCERFGTEYDAHIAAWSALSAVLSILVEVPIEHHEDATALMLTLIHSGWRHLPHHQRARVGQRMARYVADRIAGEPFVPFVPIGT
jgi:hypothetical protein